MGYRTIIEVGEHDLSQLRELRAIGRAQTRPGESTFRCAIWGCLRGSRER